MRFRRSRPNAVSPHENWFRPATLALVTVVQIYNAAATRIKAHIKKP